MRLSRWHSQVVAMGVSTTPCNHVVVAQMTQKLSDVALKLVQLSRPTFVNGRWRKPPLSGRKLEEVKRILRAQGEDIPLKPLRDRGGDKPLKLHKWERNREARQAKIEENMRLMPQWVEEYRKKRREGREKMRKEKERTENEEYLLAIDRTKENRPAWQVLKEMTESGKKTKK